MIKLFSLVVLITACVAIENPSYTVLSSIGDHIEIRRYAPTKWITTTDFGQNLEKYFFNHLLTYF